MSNPSSFEFSDPTEDSSEDFMENRALPNAEIQGYNVFGQVIELPPAEEPGDKLKKFTEL